MLTIASFNPSVLGQLKLEGYRKLATWEWAEQLDAPPVSTVWFIGLEDEDSPLGLCICTLDKFSGYCDISYLRLTPEIAIATNYIALFSYLTEMARLQGIRFLSLLYPAPADGAVDPLIQALDAMNWQPPRLWSKQLTFDVQAYRSDWLYSKSADLSPLEIFPWAELSETEAQSVRHHFEQYNLPAPLSPFLQSKWVQPINSLGLRDANGNIVGWVITHTFPETPDNVRYSCFYVHPDLLRSAASIHLLRQSILLQKKSGIPYATFDFGMRDTEGSWQKFIEKRLAPHALKITDFLQRRYIL